MAYNAKVLDHYENPRNVGSFDKQDLFIGTGMVGAPSCGDVMKLQIKVNPENGIIQDAKFKTFGCGSAIASSSLATEWLKGTKIEDALKIKNRDIATELGLPPVKYHCSVLAEDAIKAAIEDYQEKQNHGIIITEKALTKIASVLNADKSKLAIRFIAKDGGCSGKKYDITLEESVGNHHLLKGAYSNVLIDETSLDLLKNMTIDHEINDLGEKFIFTNPNATSHCGCGQSFS